MEGFLQEEGWGKELLTKERKRLLQAKNFLYHADYLTSIDQEIPDRLV